MRGIGEWMADREAQRRFSETLLAIRDEAVKNARQHFADVKPTDCAIPLGEDLFALIDGEDFEFIGSMKWHAVPRPDIGHVATQTLIGPFADEEMFMHRIIMRCFDDHLVVDHKNGNGLDNRRSSNLRICTRQQNQWNRRKRRGQSVFKGVRPEKGGQQIVAYITVSGRRIRLGCFTSEIDAAHAYDDAARLHFGEFACVNFPREGEQGALDASVLDALKHHAGDGACLPASCGVVG